MKKRFKKQSDLIKVAIGRVARRKSPKPPEPEDWLTQSKMKAKGLM